MFTQVLVSRVQSVVDRRASKIIMLKKEVQKAIKCSIFFVFLEYRDFALLRGDRLVMKSKLKSQLHTSHMHSQISLPQPMCQKKGEAKNKGPV